MAGTTELTTTSLVASCTAGDARVQLASTAGLTVNNLTNLYLFIDQELLGFVLLLPEGNGWVRVTRGADGTFGAAHGSSAIVTIGRADQFYEFNPRGVPPSPPLVSPWINVRNGTIWYAQGDATGPGVDLRYWLNVTTTYNAGPFGVPTVTTAPTAST